MVCVEENVKEVEGVTEVVPDTVEVRQREGDEDGVEYTEGEGLPVLLTLPHLLTLEHPLPVMDREVVLQVVGEIELVVVTVLDKQRVGV